jgi:hypothetical protein
VERRPQVGKLARVIVERVQDVVPLTVREPALASSGIQRELESERRFVMPLLAEQRRDLEHTGVGDFDARDQHEESISAAVFGKTDAVGYRSRWISASAASTVGTSRSRSHPEIRYAQGLPSLAAPL